MTLLVNEMGMKVMYVSPHGNFKSQCTIHHMLACFLIWRPLPFMTVAALSVWVSE